MALESFHNVCPCFLCQPLFMDLSFQAVHTPLQAPQEYIDLYDEIEDEDRRIFAGKKKKMSVLHKIQ